MDILTRLPDELKDHVISFYGCKHCCCNKYCHIHELHKKYSRPIYECNENDYEFIGESEIKEIDAVHYYNQLYICTISGHFPFANKNTVVTARSFATNIPVELIDVASFDIGGLQIEKVEAKLFDALYSIYSIPEKNENEYTMIPFYISKIGIEKLVYHEIKIFIRLKENVNINNIKVQFHLQDARGSYDVRKTRYLYFSYIISSYQRLPARRPLYYILIEGDVPEITISNMTLYKTPGIDELTLSRSKKFKHVSLFKIAQSLYDFEHSIDFSEICSARLNIDEGVKIYVVERDVIVTTEGMGGVLGFC